LEELARAVLSFTHISATIGWLGGVFFILFYVHPKSREYFDRDRDLDSFLTVLAHGARWHVLAALVAIGLSGAGLVALDGHFDATGIAFLGNKVLALASATAVFCFETWYLWPRRVFATAAELAGELRKFRLLGFVLFSCGSAGVLLGTVVAFR
jgi:uncharacterized membrane protein